jgi:hypothetical protein
MRAVRRAGRTSAEASDSSSSITPPEHSRVRCVSGDGKEPTLPANLSGTRAWRLYLVALALVPLPMLWVPLRNAQLAYAVVGALFMPLLAATLLVMNNRRDWVGELRGGWLVNAALTATLLLFLWVGLDEALDALRKLRGP